MDRRPASTASLASSEFEELRFDDDLPMPAAEASKPAQGSAALAANRFLPSSTGLMSGIFGKTRSVPGPSSVPSPSISSGGGAAPAAAAPAAQEAHEPSVLPPVEEAVHLDRAAPAGRSPTSEQEAQEQQQDPFKELEAATQKLGEAARDAASQLLGNAADARSSLARLAGDVSSWWATLDPSAPPAAPTPDRQTEACHKLFGLDASEELMEDFQASLAQTYACAHNTLTPSREVLFSGTLYITSRHMCFSSTADRVAAAVPFADVSRAAVAGRHLSVTLQDGSTLALTAFQPGSLNSALGLIEHLSQ